MLKIFEIVHQLLNRLLYQNHNNYTFLIEIIESPEAITPTKAPGNDDNKKWLDSLGNLCLISKRANSQNSDTTPLTKATDTHKYDLTKLTPKRAVMYSTTVNNKKWDSAEIEEHYKCVIELLNNAERILFL